MRLHIIDQKILAAARLHLDINADDNTRNMLYEQYNTEDLEVSAEEGERTPAESEQQDYFLRWYYYNYVHPEFINTLTKIIP